MSGTEKFKIVFEAQEAASAKIRTLNAELAHLGGPAMVKSQKEINKLTREINMLSGETKKSGGLFSSMWKGVAVGTMVASAVTSAVSALGRELLSVPKAIAESESAYTQLFASMETHRQMSEVNSVAVHKWALAMQEASTFSDEQYATALQRIIDMGVPLQSAMKLVGGAADYAAKKNLDLVEAATMIGQVAGGARDKLRGLDVSLKGMGDKTERATKLLASLESHFGGGATAKLETYSGQLSLMSNMFDELKETIGKSLLPTMTEAAKTIVSFVKTLTTAAFGDPFKKETDKTTGAGTEIITMLRSVQANMKAWVDVVIGGSKIIYNAFMIVANVMSIALTPFIYAIKAVVLVLKGDFKQAAETGAEAFTHMKNSAGNLLTDFSDLWTAAKQLGQGFTELDTHQPLKADPLKVIKESTKETLNTIRVEIPKAVRESEETQEELFAYTNRRIQENAHRGTRAVQSSAQQLVSAMGGMFNNGVDNMVNAFVTGRQSIGDAFKGMAQDFMAFFVKQALAYILNLFIPGLGKILGSIFDTPANDAMAAKQGGDFSMHFIKGALKEMTNADLGRQIVSSTRAISAVPSTAATMHQTVSGLNTGNFNAHSIAPSAARRGGDMITLNISISGNVMSDQFVEKTIAPKLNKLIAQGHSRLTLSSENKTGTRDINIV